MLTFPACSSMKKMFILGFLGLAQTKANLNITIILFQCHEKEKKEKDTSYHRVKAGYTPAFAQFKITCNTVLLLEFGSKKKPMETFVTYYSVYKHSMVKYFHAVFP